MRISKYSRQPDSSGRSPVDKRTVNEFKRDDVDYMRSHVCLEKKTSRFPILVPPAVP